MYGRRIYEAYPAVPLGLIESDVGGTNIQAWTPPEALASCGVAPTHFTPSPKISCPPYCNSSSLFNGMISPLLNYAIHHVVWYQVCNAQITLQQLSKPGPAGRVELRKY